MCKTRNTVFSIGTPPALVPSMNATQKLEAARDALIAAAAAFAAAQKEAEKEMRSANKSLGEDAEWADLLAWTPECNDLESMCDTLLKDKSLRGALVRKGG